MDPAHASSASNLRQHLDALLATDGGATLLAEGLSRPHGDPFLDWLVHALAEHAAIDWAMVGILAGEQLDAVEVLAGRGPEGSLSGLDYELCGTPCQQVLARGAIEVIPTGVTALFPDDPMLVDMGAEGYVGMSVIDSHGQALGIVACVGRSPLQDVDLIVSLLSVFRARVSSELGRRRALRDLALAVEASTPHAGAGDVFHQLVRTLANAMQVKMAFVSEALPGEPSRARTLADLCDGEFQGEREYVLRDTPSEQVYEQGFLFVPEGVSRRFPGDAELRHLRAEGYLGRAMHDADGRVLGHLGIIHDGPLPPRVAEHHLFRILAQRLGAEIERRRAEQHTLEMERELQQTQKLESLGVLAGGIAHDFNNLLVGILGRVSMASLDVPEGSPLAEHLLAIDGAARNAAELARQMLAYSGRGRFVVERVDPEALVEELLTLLRASVPHTVELACERGDFVPEVEADPVQLRQVVMNLVINGAEACGDEAGTVSVRLGEAWVDAARLARARHDGPSEPGSYLLLEVRDTGEGLDDETLERIFDPFFTTKFTGRGLGLAAVQGILRGHGGLLEVDSRVGHGSTFRVLLPAAPTSSARGEVDDVKARVDPLAWDGHGTLLVIDDERSVREAAKVLLESMGFRVLTAADGLQGLDLHAREPVRGVLLDMTMPQLDGLGTLAALREREPELPVVLMSGYSEQEADERFHGHRLSGFLQKPFDIETLVRVLRRALEGSPEDVGSA